ncbi:hypothetical protein PanWU01x14_149880 [Parasponia andersonii]|uniref:Uncharacterized protein n=1 Tax=Parasponia andersonii TaxID=3476 RepID=A0A2P5CII8_PARAD|nr:hypothetical protein PanWU01x14_149880 [Parasponia andersonii]
MDRMGWKFNKPDPPDRCVHLLPKGFGLVGPGRSWIWLLKAIILTSRTKLQNCLTNLSLLIDDKEIAFPVFTFSGSIGTRKLQAKVHKNFNCHKLILKLILWK